MKFSLLRVLALLLLLPAALTASLVSLEGAIARKTAPKLLQAIAIQWNGSFWDTLIH